MTLNTIDAAKLNIQKFLIDEDEKELIPTKATKDIIRGRNANKEIVNFGLSKIILKKQKNQDGEVWVYVFLDMTYKEFKSAPVRVRRKYNTGVSILPKDWSYDKEEIHPSSFSAKVGNPKIRTFFSDIYNTISQLVDGKDIELRDDLKELKHIFGSGIKKQETNSKPLTYYIGQYIDYRKGTNTPSGTLKEFTTILNRIKEFELNNKTIYLKDINLILSDNLIKAWAAREYHPNTIAKSFTTLRTVLNHYYERREELKIELSDKFRSKSFGKVKEYEQPPIALTDVEIDLIRNFDFKRYFHEQLALLEKEIKKQKIEFKREFMIAGLKNKVATLRATRDRALLQISTGLRVSDLFKIKPVNIDLAKRQIKLKTTKGLTTKSDSTVVIPLFPMAKEILSRPEYNYNTSRKPFKVSSQKYNDAIKVLLEAVGIDDLIEIVEFKGFKATTVEKRKYEVITSHNFRDTFITSAIRNNITIPVLLKWTGQSSYEVMKKYINLTEQDLTKTVSLFQ